MLTYQTYHEMIEIAIKMNKKHEFLITVYPHLKEKRLILNGNIITYFFSNF